MNKSAIKSFVKDNSWVVVPAIISFISTLVLLTNITKPYSQASVMDSEKSYSNSSSNEQMELVQDVTNKSIDIIAANTGGCGCPACCSVN
jgi:hypothetical protein